MVRVRCVHYLSEPAPAQGNRTCASLYGTPCHGVAPARPIAITIINLDAVGSCASECGHGYNRRIVYGKMWVLYPLVGRNRAFGMAAAIRKSLWEFYPRRLDIPIYLVLLLGLLITAQCLPVLSIKKFVFWKSQYSLWSGTIGLFRDQHYSLGMILLTFSIFFPFAKLCTLLVLWCGKFTDKQRLAAFKWLEILGRWSMLDVFVVAMIVVIAKSGGALKASPKIGIYLFAVAVLFSLIITVHIRALARRVSRRKVPE